MFNGSRHYLSELNQSKSACKAFGRDLRREVAVPTGLRGRLRPPGKARQHAELARQLLEHGAIGARTPLWIEQAAVDAAPDADSGSSRGSNPSRGLMA
jgi:hypothetical protein